MRFVYADPGLINNLGHHANACRLITSELRARGIVPTVLGHQHLTSDLANELRALPHFRIDTYWMSDGDPISGFLNAFITAAEATSRDIARIPEISRADVIYFNSIGAAQLLAIASWVSALPVLPQARIIAEFGGDSGLVPVPGPNGVDYKPGDVKPMFYRFAMTRFPKNSAAVLHLKTFDEFTSSVFSSLLRYPVGVLPMHFVATGALQSRVGRRPITIAVVGHQRHDKGYDLVPEVVRHVLQARPEVRFLIHNGAPEVMPLVQQKVRELAAADPRIRIDERMAGPDVWQQLLAASDIVVCPYQPQRFHAAYSAVAVEALANAIPLVGPAVTSLDRLILAYGGFGTSFSRFEPTSVADATLRLLERFDHYAEIAFVGAQKFALASGPRHTVDAILSHAAA